jgi:hypothetical protein
MDSRIKRTATAIAVATALAMPGVALAQTDTEKALEARIAELEKLVNEMAAKQAAPKVVVSETGPAAAPAPAPAPTVNTANKGSLTIKGFVIASLYAQDQNFAFGNGQNAEFPTSDYSKDDWTLGGDVRNTRLTLDWKGPEVEGFNVGGLLEADFFGGFGAGAFTDEQPIPRMRLAYVDITKGSTTYRIGQAWSPMFGNVPVSPTHVAFPLGYGAAGDVGWRYPGLFVYHTFSKSTKLTLAAMRGSWNDSSVPFGNGAGESGVPQLEARLDFSAENWSVYVVGHYDQKDCNLVGDTATTNVCGASYTKKSLDGTAVEFGAKAKFGNFSLQGNVYSGTAIGQQFGHITQFGDISGWGGWLQGSFKFSGPWSANLFYGLDDPKDSDVLSQSPGTARLKNEMIAASVMYSKGPYVFGVEWLNDQLTRPKACTEFTCTSNDLEGNQLSFSAWYKF